MSFFVTADGGLTTAGYVGCVVLMVALVVIASVLSAQKSKGTGMDARKLAFCAMGMALAFVTSYVKVFELPYGGSVTLFSMLFIVLIANWYGAKTGILVGFAYGLLQFIQGPYVLSLFQVCCDCVLCRYETADRVCEMATDLRTQLCERSKNFIAYSLAVDESTDMMDIAQLAIFIRGEEILNIKSMHGTTTGKDIFKMYVKV